SVGAHVTLPNDAPFFRIFRHVIGTLQNAILAADALIIEMPDNSGERVFVVSVDRATVHASRIDAMVTRRRHSLLNRFGYRASKQHSDISPGLFAVQAVQIVASGHARLTAGASVEINRKRILLAWRRQRQRDQVAVILRLRWASLFM